MHPGGHGGWEKHPGQQMSGRLQGQRACVGRWTAEGRGRGSRLRHCGWGPSCGPGKEEGRVHVGGWGGRSSSQLQLLRQHYQRMGGQSNKIAFSPALEAGSSRSGAAAFCSRNGIRWRMTPVWLASDRTPITHISALSAITQCLVNYSVFHSFFLSMLHFGYFMQICLPVHRSYLQL